MRSAVLFRTVLACLSGTILDASAAVHTPLERAASHLLDRSDDGLPLHIYKDLVWPGNMDYALSVFIGNASALKIVENKKGSGIRGTCIRFENQSDPWAGIFWRRTAEGMEDRLDETGRNLTGTSVLTFRAKAVGGEVKGHYGLGDEEGPTKDSDSIRSSGTRFGTAWKTYTLDLHGRDLHSIANAFYFGLDEKGVVLVDEIRFDRKRPASTARFTPSFQIKQPSSLHPVNFCAAHSYDQAMSMIALAVVARDSGVSASIRKSARAHLRVQAKAMLAAMNHDRTFKDGRLRNVYWGGADLLDSAGKARLNGWWSKSKQKWLEDQYSVSTSTGNMAWAGLALTEAWDVLQKPDKQGSYLAAAKRIANWIETHTRDDVDGYRGGINGWEGAQTAILWKSTEHNLDVIALGRRLHTITDEAKWKRMSAHAESFVDTMFDATEGHYWTGTKDDGSINRDVIPLDCQTWAALALGDTPQTRSAIQWALDHLQCISRFAGKTVTGYSFGTAQSGVWPEGTAQMVLACTVLGKKKAASAALANLLTIQSTHPNGNRRGLVAACDDFQGTGFDSNRYFAIPHIGATAWFALAQTGSNPMR